MIPERYAAIAAGAPDQTGEEATKAARCSSFHA